MELDLNFVREKVLDKTLKVPNIDQIANIFTKPTSHHHFSNKLRNMLGIAPLGVLELRGIVRDN